MYRGEVFVADRNVQYLFGQHDHLHQGERIDTEILPQAEERWFRAELWPQFSVHVMFDEAVDDFHEMARFMSLTKFASGVVGRWGTPLQRFAQFNVVQLGGIMGGAHVILPKMTILPNKPAILS